MKGFERKILRFMKVFWKGTTKPESLILALEVNMGLEKIFDSLGGNCLGLIVLEAFHGGGKCNSNGRELLSEMEASVEGV